MSTRSVSALTVLALSLYAITGALTIEPTNAQSVLFGCINVLKEGFDANNQRITSPLPNFTFTLDGNQTVQTNAQGIATFSNVTPGARMIVETPLAGWTQFNVTPITSIVDVIPGTNCAGIVFKNRQQAQDADLRIIKTGPATVQRGQNAVYQIAVKNLGPANASNVIVGDPLPAGTTFVAAQSDNRCQLQGNNVFCTLGTMTANQEITLTLTLAVTAQQTCTPGTIINRASVLADQQDRTLTNNESSVSTSVTCPQQLVGCIDIFKEGFDAGGSRLASVPPFKFILDGSGSVFVHSNSVGNARFSNVRVGQHTVSEVTASGWTLFNTTPTGSIIQVQPGNACVGIVFKNRQQAQDADLRIIKTGPATVQRGQNAVYQIAVKNLGPANASNVIVGDPLPAGTTFVAAQSDNRCQLQGTNVFCTLGTMTANQEITLTLTLAVTAQQTCTPGTIINRASVLADQQDRTLTNNESSFSTSVTCPQPTTADVSVVKTGPTTVQRGSNLTYQLVVSNAGPATASGIVLTDTVPSGLTLVSSGTGCTLTNGVVTCQVGSVTPTTPRTYNFVFSTGTVPANCTTTSVTNTGVVTSASTDANTQNNQSSATTQINCPNAQMGCIDVIKETFDTNGTLLTPVTQFTFNLDGTRTAVNGSDGRARFENVSLGSHTVTETIPTSWTQQSITPAGGTVNVIAGSCVTVTFKNRQNAFSSTTGFSITKTDNESSVEPGDSLTYRITVRNTGTTRRTNITVRDTLPDEVSFKNASPNEDSENGRVIRWENQTFEAGETKTYEVDVDVDDDADGTIRNDADVDGITATDRTDVDNNSNSRRSSNDAKIDLTKTASTSEVFPGGIIDYTVRVRNRGDKTIKDLTVIDNLPADVIVIDDGDADDRSGRRLSWEIDKLDEGDEEIFRYRVSVPTYMVAGQIIRNNVCAESDDLDEECESVSVSVLGIIPKTGAKVSSSSSVYLTAIDENTSSGGSALPFLGILALAGVGTGIAFGRRFFL